MGKAKARDEAAQAYFQAAEIYGGPTDGAFKCGFDAGYDAARQSAADLEAENKRLREALEDYADEEHWRCGDNYAHENNNVCSDCNKDTYEQDGYSVAQVALAAASKADE